LLICGPERDIGGRAVFVFKILVVLSSQFRAPTALSIGNYSPVGLAVERRINGFTEAVWTLSRRDKCVASARNRKTILRTLSSG
jgi:hypothetical protein